MNYDQLVSQHDDKPLNHVVLFNAMIVLARCCLEQGSIAQVNSNGQLPDLQSHINLS